MGRGPTTVACVLLLLGACVEPGEPDMPVEDPANVRFEPLADPVHLDGRGLLYHPPDWGEEVGLDHRTELEFSEADRHLDDFTGGFAALDCDADGDVDLLFTSGDGANQLFLNDGSGRFELLPDAGVTFLGDRPAAASAADYDRDGDPDLLLLNQFGQNRLLANDGSCMFHEVTAEVGLDDLHRSLSATWVDLDGNGWLDLYVSNWASVQVEAGVPPAAEPDRLWLSDGEGRFVDVSDLLPPDLKQNFGMTSGFLDVDGDGDLDLLQVNDKGGWAVGNRLYRNDGVDFDRIDFVDLTQTTGFALDQDAMGMAFVDLDLDGDVDVINTGDVEAVFLDGGETYVEAGAALGLEDEFLPPVSWGVVSIDVNADGAEDIFYVRSHFFDSGPEDPEQYGGPALLYLNDLPGGGGLLRQELSGTLGSLQTWRTVVAVDLNGDGFEDLVVVAVDDSPLVFLANPPEGAGVIQVRLEGVTSNLEGRHAVVTLEADGRRLRRWPGAVNSYATGGPIQVTFALNGETELGPLQVRWPSGLVQQISTVRIGEAITITEPDGED